MTFKNITLVSEIYIIIIIVLSYAAWTSPMYCCVTLSCRCQQLTSVLATFPLCVMFLLCFSLAMRILCLATIFRNDDNHRKWRSLVCSEAEGCRRHPCIKLAVQSHGNTGNPLYVSFKTQAWHFICENIPFKRRRKRVYLMSWVDFKFYVIPLVLPPPILKHL